MTLPYPFKSGDRTISSATFKNPTAGVLADARKCAENGDVYQALLAYVAGSVSSLIDSQGGEIEGKEPVKAALRGLPWALAEWIAFQSMIALGASDEVDMEFTCPRCGASFYRDEDLVRISELKIAGSETVPEILVPLSDPVMFKDSQTGEVTESVTDIAFRLPTIGDCIRAAGKAGQQDDTRLQFAVWAEAITEINGNPVDQKWRGPFGTLTFERMAIADMRAVGKAFGAWSMDNTVDSSCRKCGKQYRAEVPTGSFFASALRGA